MEPWKMKLGLLVLILVALAGLVFWLRWRADRNAAEKHAARLAKFAHIVGGTLTDASGDARPWSAGLAQAFASDHGGVVEWLGRATEVRFDHALDFERDGWRVRISEASFEKYTATTSGNTVTHHEHRIEIATAGLVPLKIVRSDWAGGSGARRWAGEMVRTAADGERPQWAELRLPAPVEQAFVAFTSDVHAATALFTPQVVEQLLAESRVGSLRHLTLESGIAYTTVVGQIDPDRVLTQAAMIIELLARVPGAKPAVIA